MQITSNGMRYECIGTTRRLTLAIAVDATTSSGKHCVDVKSKYQVLVLIVSGTYENKCAGNS